MRLQIEKLKVICKHQFHEHLVVSFFPHTFGNKSRRWEEMLFATWVHLPLYFSIFIIFFRKFSLFLKGKTWAQYKVLSSVTNVIFIFVFPYIWVTIKWKSLIPLATWWWSKCQMLYGYFSHLYNLKQQLWSLVLSPMLWFSSFRHMARLNVSVFLEVRRTKGTCFGQWNTSVSLPGGSL